MHPVLFYVQMELERVGKMLLLSGLGWEVEGGRSQVTGELRPPGWLAGWLGPLLS